MKDSTTSVHAQVPVDVATFLLNEKRAEIHEIESRFKTSIMLIPNIHMETPNYSVVRLRSDEIGSEETPSYRMVDMPAEIATEKTLSAEDKPQRQIAAVRGITTGQPAPMATEEKTKQTWFGKVKTWLQGLGGAQPEEEVKPKARPARSDKRREPRNEGRGEGREVKRDRDAERGEPRRTERGEGRGGQKPRPPAQPQVKREKEAIAPQAAAPATDVKTGETEGQEPRSRRGRRGGRRERGERTERPEAPRNLPESTEVSSEKAPVAIAPETASTKIEKAEATPEKESETHLPVTVQEHTAVLVVPTEPSKPVEAESVSAAPAEAAPVAPAEAAPVAVAEVAPVAVAESKPRAPRRRAPQAVSDDQIASSGLVMVETSPDKIKVVVEEAVANAPERVRPRRAPRPKIVEESAPLVQVETQHK